VQENLSVRLCSKVMSAEGQTLIASTRYSLISGTEKKATFAGIMFSRRRERGIRSTLSAYSASVWRSTGKKIVAGGLRADRIAEGVGVDDQVEGGMRGDSGVCGRT
jgi:hypothetical protein